MEDLTQHPEPPAAEATPEVSTAKPKAAKKPKVKKPKAKVKKAVKKATKSIDRASIPTCVNYPSKLLKAIDRKARSQKKANGKPLSRSRFLIQLAERACK